MCSSRSVSGGWTGPGRRNHRRQGSACARSSGRPTRSRRPRPRLGDEQPVNGSRWWCGSCSKVAACSSVIGAGAAPAEVSTSTRSAGASSLPSERLIAISHTTAALSSRGWWCRRAAARPLRPRSPRQATRAPRACRSGASPSTEGVGDVVGQLVESSAMRTLPFHAPRADANDDDEVTGTSRATGVPLRVDAISSPASARSTAARAWSWPRACRPRSCRHHTTAS